jgi:protein-disulfide isomerase
MLSYGKIIKFKFLEADLNSSKSKRDIIREKRKEQKRQRLMIFILILIAAAVLFSAAVILPKILVSNKNNENTTGFSIGKPNAPVIVVEFSSYSCGVCKTFSENNEEDFIANYVDTGDVFFTYVNIPNSNSEQSLAAAEASYCAAEQNKFFEYKKLLYKNAGSSDAYTTDNLVGYAASANLITDDFQTCLDSDKYIDAYLQDYEYARSIGVTGTPSFLVNETLVYANDLITTVESELNKNLN